MEQIAAVQLQTGQSNALATTSRQLKERALRLSEILMFLAEARQVSVSEATVRVYLTVLAKHDPQDVDRAVRQLVEEPRGQFKPAFPEVGEIVDRVEQARRLRTTPPKFVPCGSCFDGLVYTDENGQPCDVSASPSRAMAMCNCKRAWMAERRRRAEIAA